MMNHRGHIVRVLLLVSYYQLISWTNSIFACWHIHHEEINITFYIYCCLYHQTSKCSTFVCTLPPAIKEQITVRVQIHNTFPGGFWSHTTSTWLCYFCFALLNRDMYCKYSVLPNQVNQHILQIYFTRHWIFEQDNNSWCTLPVGQNLNMHCNRCTNIQDFVVWLRLKVTWKVEVWNL